MRRWSIVDPTILFGYAAISFGYFGWRLLPHPGRFLIGTKHDPLIFVWSFAWWPHAIGSWTNPFITHALYAPTGINLAWTASAPGLALAFSPLTILFGPVVAYNVAALAMPALSAWTAYLLCRHLTHSIWASVVGGYLFGFSSYILGHQLEGHLHLTGVFLLPLIALAVVRYLQGELGARRLVWRLGVLIALQLWISTEVALTLTIALALALALAFWLVREARPRLRSALIPIVSGYALGALLAAPLIVYLLLGFLRGSFSDAGAYGTDLLNFVIPTHSIGIGGSTFTSVSANFPGNYVEPGAYLGLPTLAVAVAFALRARRSAVARFLVAALVLAGAIALGATLQVDGHRLVRLPPWRLAAHVPGLDNALPARFAVYLSLAAAVIVAFWTATTRGRVYSQPYLLPTLAVVALVPAVLHSYYRSHPERLAFFTDGTYKTCLRNGETLAVFPFGTAGDSMLWQAESGFRFRLAEGDLHAGVFAVQPLTTFDKDPVVHELDYIDYARPTMDRLLAFAANHHVDRILSVESHGYPSGEQMRSFGRVERAGGVFVAPACGQASLATRDLTAYVKTNNEQLRSGASIAYCAGANFNLLPAGLYPAGPLASLTRAVVLKGTGLTCVIRSGFKQHGYASPSYGVPANTYKFYSRD